MTTEQIRQAILKEHPHAVIREEKFHCKTSPLLVTVLVPRKGGQAQALSVWAVGTLKKALSECARKLYIEIT